MAAVEVTISGVLYDKLNRTTQQVVLIGDAMLTGLGVGGGPMPPGQGGGGQPPGIWGPPGPWPSPPIHLPPGGGGGQPPGQEPHPEHPIVIPPGSPNVPPPGSPPVIVPGTQPTNPMTPPSAIVIQYPGIGKVVVPQPTQTAGGPVQGA
ncbi:MAG TPA: hypothetical protein VF748_12130 [Candidatus Acidoferrum sp.]